jgi:hypothetical protein
MPKYENVRKINFIKKLRKKNLRQSWLTWLIYYPGYLTVITQQKKMQQTKKPWA